MNKIASSVDARLSAEPIGVRGDPFFALAFRSTRRSVVIGPVE
jgi:hypothetical protein